MFRWKSGKSLNMVFWRPSQCLGRSCRAILDESASSSGIPLPTTSFSAPAMTIRYFSYTYNLSWNEGRQDLSEPALRKTFQIFTVLTSQRTPPQDISCVILLVVSNFVILKLPLQRWNSCIQGLKLKLSIASLFW